MTATAGGRPQGFVYLARPHWPPAPAERSSRPVDMSLVNQMLAMKMAQTREIAGMKMLKAEHDMQRTLIDMIEEVARAAPAPGQGTAVDKSA